MQENETTTITNLQKDLIIKHLCDMNTRATVIIEEASCLTANFKAVKMILDDATEITIKNK